MAYKWSSADSGGMSTTGTTADAIRPTRASIDVTDATAAEVRALAADDGRAIHLERRGGRTFLVADSDGSSSV